MLVLIQVINQMIKLEYSKQEISDYFEKVLKGDILASDLFDTLLLTDGQQARFLRALPKYKSAVEVAFLANESEVN